MSEGSAYGPQNPHPLSRLKTELVWEGKYDEYGNRREIEIAGADLPLQKVESIDEPRSSAEGRGQLELWKKRSKRQDDFRNMLIWGDNKLVMASLLRDFRGKIDLIYIDPPFALGADFTMDVPVGDGKEAIAKDQSILEAVAYRDMWGRGTDSYVHVMYERLCLMKDLLKDSGSLYLHCDETVSYLLRCILDEVFGSANFVREIVWRIGWISGYKSSAENWIRNHDTILFYKKGETFAFNKEYIPYPPDYVRRDGKKPTGPGYPIEDTWNCSDMDRLDSIQIMSFSGEKTGYATQKNENLLRRIVAASSSEDDLVADLFCGSGTTGAVAEELGRRWIMCDLGRFAIHTSRKRMIELQRERFQEGNAYRAFDVFNLGRYERQWWQTESLKGADEEHREIVLAFYRAEPLTGAGNPLLHGRKGPALVSVDGIDSILTLDELRPIVEAAQAAGAREVHCLAWEFEMDLKRNAEAVEHEYGVKVRLIRIPREVMEKNRRPGVDEVPFFEMATLDAEALVRIEGGIRTVDVKLTNFLPSLSEVPSKELEALQERAVKSGFDFIDFWAVDFDHHDGEPFNHHWQDYRLRKDRTLKTVSDCAHTYEDSDPHVICVKVIDVFGCDTSTLLNVPGATKSRKAKR